jgi:hypothetical protein
MNARPLVTPDLRWLIRSLTCLALLGGAAAACGVDDPPFAGPGAGTGANGQGGGTVGPCSDGATRECHVTIGEHNGVLTCYYGTQSCEDGSWGQCTDGAVVNKKKSGEWQAKSYSQPAACQNNPCDPECKIYDEVPTEPWFPDGEESIYDWPTGAAANVPDSVWEKVGNEPCETGADCQMNQYCYDPASGSCTHDICELGVGLTLGCGTCADMICAQDPQCCEKTYVSSNCGHDVCTIGPKLVNGCSTCTTSVCSYDPYCCNTHWDSICVNEALSDAACTCNTPTPNSCSHPESQQGVALVNGCSACATAVCAANPSCCTTTWDATCVSAALASPDCQCTGGSSCSHAENVQGAPLSSSCSLCAASVCSYDPYCCSIWWDGICVTEAQSDPDCACANNTPLACGHDPCVEGAALSAGCHADVFSVCQTDPSCCNTYWTASCVAAFNAISPGGCPASWPGDWNQGCVDAVNSVCGAYCQDPPPPSGKGDCWTWSPGETNPSCNGYDLSVSIPCDGTIPVCNHGTQTVPAGVTVMHVPENSGYFGDPSPPAVPGAVTCQTTEPIFPGECIGVTGCATNLIDGREIIVNPPGAGQLPECNHLDNWGVFVSGPCGLPSCASQNLKANIRPVNMFVTVDKSGSMAGSRWNNTKSAFTAFFQDPGAAGLGVALEFFPHSGCYASSSECGNPTNCSIPHVALGQLTADPAPTDTQEQALIAAFNAFSPGGGTPALLALQGCHLWGANHTTANPDAQQICVLVTDGYPTDCGTSTGAFTTAAANGYNNYGVLTYGIGIVGADETLLNSIATAGNGQAFFIDSNNNIEAQLVAALNAIKGDAVSCEIDLPPGTYDPLDAIVTYQPTVGNDVPLTRVTSAAQCGSSSSAYHFDDPNNPTQIILCPQTCSTIQGDLEGEIDLVFPCPAHWEVTAKTKVYEAVCPQGLVPQWGYFGYDVTAISDSYVVFEARAAQTQADLATATSEYLATARSTPTDTQLCPMNGSVAGCPVDLYAVFGTPAAHRSFLELIATLHPSSNNGQGPTVNSWNVTYSCIAAQ